MSEGKHIVDMYIEAYRDARDLQVRVEALELENLNLRTERDAAHREVADLLAKGVCK